MSDENHNVEVKEEKCNCFCHSKGFRKFLVVALGSFVGVFCALSLFAALHKPPMMMPCPCGCQFMMRPGFAQHFDRGDFRKFHKHHMKHMDKFGRPDSPMPPRGMEGPGPVQPPVQR